MTALRQALCSVGFNPSPRQPKTGGPIPENRNETRQPITLPDTSSWDDAEVEKQAIIHEEEAAAIIRQLADDLAAGRVAEFGWRSRANNALTHRRATAKHLRAELHRRRYPIHTKPVLTPEERNTLARQREEETAARRAARKGDEERHHTMLEERRRAVEIFRAERTAFHEARAAAQHTKFVDAARLALTGEQFATIWQRARDMCPDDPCWKPIPK